MKNKFKNFPWIAWGLLICFGASVILTCMYASFRSSARNWQDNPYENMSNLEWLCQSTYLLYQDLYNVQNGTRLSYAQLYLKPDEGYELLLDRERLAQLADTLAEHHLENGEFGNADIANNILSDSDLTAEIQNEILLLESWFNNLEKDFRNLNDLYHYCIRDNVTGKYLTNMSETQAEQMLDGNYGDCFFLVTFQYDGLGNLSIGDIRSQNEDSVRKNANLAARDDSLAVLLTAGMEEFFRYGSVTPPKDCTILYAVPAEDKNLQGHYFYLDKYNQSGLVGFTLRTYIGDDYSLQAYESAGIPGILLSVLLVMAVLGMFLPLPVKTKPWNESRLFRPCLELLTVIVLLLVGLSVSLGTYHVAFSASGLAAESIRSYFQISISAAGVVAAVCNLAVLTVLFLPGWYIGVCARGITERGLIPYIKGKSIIYRFFPFVKGKVLGLYHGLEHIDLTGDAHKIILKIVICNAVVLFIISSIWFGGFIVTVIYSVLLYFILRKYISDLQKRYRILLKATNEMAAGNLNVSIREDLGVFEPFKPELAKIQEGFRKAVDQEVRSQKLKTELITNVSHDLKTPLTAIITYVNLLEEENLTEEQRREYLKILEQKSLRLKALIEDLFEVSKANSQNVTLNLAEIDIMNLVKQVALELSDKLEETDLELRMNLTDEKVLLSLDSQKTYRIYENLFGNIAKYAMKGTRVYVNGFRIDDTVVITLKNISAQELTVDAGELTERFVRGDVSRNTEGSGLGLAIAKSFTELQGGTLTLEVDGDLFKATTTWRRAADQTE
ncbi:MAG: sensor histidine kinase [Butyrivibrio sp.]|nr:sensor histidine kinase [Acetatifactor muris]MCM1558031.1 sensor histidine kinase [Butyrivibrio sp.]